MDENAVIDLDSEEAEVTPSKVPADADAKAIAESISHIFDRLDANSFAPKPVWRDLFALTGTSRTFYGTDDILEAWAATMAEAPRTMAAVFILGDVVDPGVSAYGSSR